ncbi:MAG: HDIG domain-containing protein [bacterium]|nr:HDIG domain-containing protein [bacterium]
MKDEPPQRSGKLAARLSAKSQQPSRKLNLPSRVRGRVRRGADRFLGAHLLWSVLLVALALAILIGQRSNKDWHRFSVGDVAPYDVKATLDIPIVDETLTDERRRQAREGIPDVYVHDSERGMQLARELAAVFERGRRAFEEASLQGAENPDDLVGRLFAKTVGPQVRDTLIGRRFDVELERELKSAVTSILAQEVVGNKALLERKPAILLAHVPGEREEKFEHLESYDRIIDLEQARADLRDTLSRGLAALDEAARDAMIVFTASFLDSNVNFDAEATETRRENAAAKIPRVRVMVARGDVLIRKNEPFTEESLSTLRAAERTWGGTFGWRGFWGLLFLLSMLAFFIYRYTDYHQRAFHKLRHLHALLVMMLLFMMALSQAVVWLAGVITDDLASPFNRLSSYVYLIPLGAGAILVALLANGRIANVYAGFAALLFGAMHGMDFHLTLWAMVVQLSGVYAISTYRERAALLRAGLVVGGAAAVSALAIEALQGNLEPSLDWAYGASLAFVGGALGVGLVISFSLPLLERLFNVLTDIRLLELSNVNNPLLSELALKAPGSYNHSLVVGTLAEEGARAIGANSLFCRVAAFYHDIGKITHAEYYVENQRGINPHDRLAPSMSALIIASHVKDGIKLAREAGLPEQIVDIIPQHHGTKLMTFFYEKAKSAADPSMGPVKEEDFRYPGPKPQTREAAIFMLADAVEAAARTVDEPNANRLREVIRKVTNSVVLDSQFDECDLTFADLDNIGKAFHKLLVSMYHHRVDYPGFEFGKPKGKPKVTELQDRKLAKGS